ncbi:hypothetical protein MMC25_001330 [Agyrium rufum]|nr:hypothetical protein [Agyrium rufum]
MADSNCVYYTAGPSGAPPNHARAPGTGRTSLLPPAKAKVPKPEPTSYRASEGDVPPAHGRAPGLSALNAPASNTSHEILDRPVPAPTTALPTMLTYAARDDGEPPNHARAPGMSLVHRTRLVTPDPSAESTVTSTPEPIRRSFLSIPTEDHIPWLHPSQMVFRSRLLSWPVNATIREVIDWLNDKIHFGLTAENGFGIQRSYLSNGIWVREEAAYIPLPVKALRAVIDVAFPRATPKARKAMIPSDPCKRTLEDVGWDVGTEVSPVVLARYTGIGE